MSFIQKFLAICCIIFTTIFVQNANAQEIDDLPNEAVANYIIKYRDLAIFEQIRVGIPASISLAQGILETGAGSSNLSKLANNHFGLKCKSNWQGETILQDDETKDECFRKYDSEKESYTDHSNYLRNNRRYSFLFDIPTKNYKEWAIGLRKAGYATNPKYSVRLINIIEKYNLQNYTTEANYASVKKVVVQEADTTLKYNKEETENTQLSKTEKKRLAREQKLKAANNDAEKIIEPEKPTIIAENIEAAKPKLEKLNGLEGFYATKGTNLIYEGDARGIKPSKLIDYNELEEAIVPMDMFVYTEKKYKKSPTKKVHIVQAEEDMYGIAQKEGLQLRSLLALNKLGSAEEPQTGARIYLQEAVSRRPQLRNANNNTAAKEMEIPVVSELIKSAETDLVVAEPELKSNEIIIEPIATETTNTIAPDKVIETKIDPQDIATNVQSMLENKVETPIAIIENPEPVAEVVEAKEPPPPPIFMEETKIIETPKTELAIPVAVVEEKIVTPIIARKSPSTYNENNVSPELRRLKQIMDDVVYAAPPLPKVVIAPKQQVSKPKVVEPIKVNKTDSKKITKPIIKAVVKDSTKLKATQKEVATNNKNTKVTAASKPLVKTTTDKPASKNTIIVLDPKKVTTTVANAPKSSSKTIAPKSNTTKSTSPIVVQASKSESVKTTTKEVKDAAKKSTKPSDSKIISKQPAGKVITKPQDIKATDKDANKVAAAKDTKTKDTKTKDAKAKVVKEPITKKVNEVVKTISDATKKPSTPSTKTPVKAKPKTK